jgi:hypothetical protein
MGRESALFKLGIEFDPPPGMITQRAARVHAD